jgi:hypothetical protein
VKCAFVYHGLIWNVERKTVKNSYIPWRTFSNFGSNVYVIKLMCRIHAAGVLAQGEGHTWRSNVRQFCVCSINALSISGFLFISARWFAKPILSLCCLKGQGQMLDIFMWLYKAFIPIDFFSILTQMT